jgi:hypothetical protein
MRGVIRMHGQTEGRRELPMEMISRKGGDTAQRFQTQVAVQIPVNMIKYPEHSGIVALKRRLQRSISITAPIWHFRLGSARPILHF